jgi:hypothetical protein
LFLEGKERGDREEQNSSINWKKRGRIWTNLRGERTARVRTRAAAAAGGGRRSRQVGPTCRWLRERRGAGGDGLGRLGPAWPRAGERERERSWAEIGPTA